MRVCFLTSSYPRYAGDMAGIFTARLAQTLEKKGISVHVVAPNDGHYPTEDSIEGVLVHRFSYFLKNHEGLAYGHGGIPANLSLNPLLFVQVPFYFLFFFLKTWHVARQCDLLHVHWAQNLFVGWPVAYLLGKPCVVTLWGSDLRWMERNRWVYYFTSLLFSGADAVACVTDAARHWLQDRGVAKGKALVIANGVDTNVFRPRDKVELRKKLGLTPEAVILLYVGNLVSYKGVGVLIDALALMKAAHPLLLLMGDGDERLNLEEKACQLNLSHRVRFLGAMAPDRVPEWMAAADAFVLPSFTEGRPNVILEAMACGLPVVATDIPANRDMVMIGKNGLLVPPGDPQALTIALDKMVSDSELRARMGEVARRSIHERQLTWEECAAKHLELYQNLILHRDMRCGN